MSDEEHAARNEEPGARNEAEAAGADSSAPASRRTARDVLYESLALVLLNAGVTMPAREFVDAVRAKAGFRAAPRQIDAAVTELTHIGQQVDVANVADIVRRSRGTIVERQHRHAERWRQLGAALTVRGMDGTPSGQRAFVGAARQVAGPHATDLLLLSVALALAEARRTLDADLVGRIGKRLAGRVHDLTPEQIAVETAVELRAIVRENRASRAASRPRRPGSSVPSRRRRQPHRKRRS